MVILISGASHTGKTVLAQTLMERYHYPYLSIDHLKMGLIRSGNTSLTPMDSDGELTAYLWPILREMVKTVIENKQNLIVEGCYIPCDWQMEFDSPYTEEIRHICLILSQRYIREHYGDIKAHANAAEQRLDDSSCTMETLMQDNAAVLQNCQAHSVPYILIDRDYKTDLERELREWLRDSIPTS